MYPLCYFRGVGVKPERCEGLTYPTGSQRNQRRTKFAESGTKQILSVCLSVCLLVTLFRKTTNLRTQQARRTRRARCDRTDLRSRQPPIWERVMRCVPRNVESREKKEERPVSQASPTFISSETSFGFQCFIDATARAEDAVRNRNGAGTNY